MQYKRGRDWKHNSRRIWVCKRYLFLLFELQNILTPNLQEFKTLKDDANVFKLVGPVLLKQDKDEAVAAVNGRLEFIGGEM